MLRPSPTALILYCATMNLQPCPRITPLVGTKQTTFPKMLRSTHPSFTNVTGNVSVFFSKVDKSAVNFCLFQTGSLGFQTSMKTATWEKNGASRAVPNCSKYLTKELMPLTPSQPPAQITRSQTDCLTGFGLWMAMSSRVLFRPAWTPPTAKTIRQFLKFRIQTTGSRPEVRWSLKMEKWSSTLVKTKVRLLSGFSSRVSKLSLFQYTCSPRLQKRTFPRKTGNGHWKSNVVGTRSGTHLLFLVVLILEDAPCLQPEQIQSGVRLRTVQPSRLRWVRFIGTNVEKVCSKWVRMRRRKWSTWSVSMTLKEAELRFIPLAMTTWSTRFPNAL